MSYLLVHQGPRRVRGMHLLDADPEWTLHPPRKQNGAWGPRLDTGEGEGAWLSVWPGTGVWAAVLHRADAPYNTCLPTGEALLAEAATKAPASPPELIDAVAARAADRFSNPFELLVGRSGHDEIHLLEHVFESRRSRRDTGLFSRSVGAGRSDRTPPPAFPSGQSIPTRTDLQTLARTSARWIEEGTRPTRAALVFEASPNGVVLDYASDDASRGDWETLRPPTRG